MNQFQLLRRLSLQIIPSSKNIDWGAQHPWAPPGCPPLAGPPYLWKIPYQCWNVILAPKLSFKWVKKEAESFLLSSKIYIYGVTTVDRFHGAKHGKSCTYSPQNNKALEQRLENVNTSAAEQIFSWFRGYSRGFNGLKKSRYHFLAFYYSKLNNQFVDAGQNNHLNVYKHQKISVQRNMRRCVCNPKKLTIRNINFLMSQE